MQISVYMGGLTFLVPFLHPGEHYIYFDSVNLPQAGQSAKLVSPPFCAPGDVCVEFAYHMYGLGEGTTLKLLLGSPAGSAPISLWNRVGSQSTGWVNSSVTIPKGHQQPMQVRDGEWALYVWGAQ